MLAQFHPKHNQTRMRVSAAHIFDEGDFFRCVLVRMAVRTVRTVSKGANRAVVLFAPAIDVLTACFAANRRIGYSVLEGIFNYCLPKQHVLCYLIHSG